MRPICIALGILVLIYTLLFFGLSDQRADAVMIGVTAFWGIVGLILICIGAPRPSAVAADSAPRPTPPVTATLGRVGSGLCGFVAALYGLIFVFMFFKGIAEALGTAVPGFAVALIPILVLDAAIAVICSIIATVFIHFAFTGRIWFGGQKPIPPGA